MCRLAAIKSDIYSASELCHNESNQAVKTHLKKPAFCLEAISKLNTI
jgi:hypothetical protein